MFGKIYLRRRKTVNRQEILFGKKNKREEIKHISEEKVLVAEAMVNIRPTDDC